MFYTVSMGASKHLHRMNAILGNLKPGDEYICHKTCTIHGGFNFDLAYTVNPGTVIIVDKIHLTSSQRFKATFRHNGTDCRVDVEELRKYFKEYLLTGVQVREIMAKFREVIEEKDRALCYADNRLETIAFFSKGEWEYTNTKSRIQNAIAYKGDIPEV